MSAMPIYFYPNPKTREKQIKRISEDSSPPSSIIKIYKEAATSILENSESQNGNLCEMHLWEFLLYGEKAFEDHRRNTLSDTEKETFDGIHFDAVCACFESHEDLPKELKDTINRLKQKFKNFEVEENAVFLPKESTLPPSESTYLLSMNSDSDPSTPSEADCFSSLLSFFSFFGCCIQRNQKNGDEKENIPLQIRHYNT